LYGAHRLALFLKRGINMRRKNTKGRMCDEVAQVFIQMKGDAYAYLTAEIDRWFKSKNMQQTTSLYGFESEDKGSGDLIILRVRFPKKGKIEKEFLTGFRSSYAFTFK
jgi:hypothetical protein